MSKEVKDQQKLSKKTWFILLWLIVFFPVGLFFMWKSNWNKIVKTVITGIFAIGIVGSIISPSTSSVTSTISSLETDATPTAVTTTDLKTPVQSSVPETTTVAATSAAEPVSTEEQSLNSNLLLEYVINEADVMNGFRTETIGKWANIVILKDEIKNISQKDFVEFVDSKVDNSGYNWFTIIFEDGTGLQFSGSNKQIGTYGELDADGCITKSIGNILLKSDNTYEYSEVNETSEATEVLSSVQETSLVEETTAKNTQTYILNKSSKKFHYPSCSSVSQIKASNYREFEGTSEELKAKGYTPCGRCKP